MNGPILSQLNEAIRAAIEQNPAWDSLAITHHVIDSHGSVVAAWTRDRIYALVCKARNKKRQEDPRQMFFEGFASLNCRLPLDDGFMVLRDAKLSLLRESLRIIVARDAAKSNPKAERIQKLINAMEPWSRAEPGLTVVEYVERAAAGEEPPPPRNRHTHEEQSAIAKRRWATYSKKKKAEISRKREETKRRRRGEASAPRDRT